MKVLKQIAIIFSICWFSQVIEAWLPFPFPASVIGMVLLFLLLMTGKLKICHIQEKSDFLLSNMAFFFIPAGVSIMKYFEILKSSIVPFLIVCILTTIITFAATAWSVSITQKLMNQRKSRKER